MKNRKVELMAKLCREWEVRELKLNRGSTLKPEKVFHSLQPTKYFHFSAVFWTWTVLNTGL